jgi:hypothetical protein
MMKCEFWHTRRIEFDRHQARRIPVNLVDQLSGEAQFSHPLQHTSSPRIFANAAHKEYGVPQLGGVGGKIKRRASQVFLISNHIPQDLTDADDSHGAASRIQLSCIFCA